MEVKGTKHENYEILNLIGYGLSKFNDDFIKEFGFTTKTNFFNYFVVKNVTLLRNYDDVTHTIYKWAQFQLILQKKIQKLFFFVEKLTTDT